MLNKKNSPNYLPSRCGPKGEKRRKVDGTHARGRRVKIGGKGEGKKKLCSNLRLTHRGRRSGKRLRAKHGRSNGIPPRPATMLKEKIKKKETSQTNNTNRAQKTHHTTKKPPPAKTPPPTSKKKYQCFCKDPPARKNIAHLKNTTPYPSEPVPEP